MEEEGAVAERPRSSGASIPYGGWGGNTPGVSGGGSTGSFFVGAAPDIAYQSIVVTVTVTSGGVTTTTTGDINSSAVADAMGALKSGDVVQVSAVINMQDGSVRNSSSDVVTIGSGGNSITLNTPYVANIETAAGTATTVYDSLYTNSPSIPGSSITGSTTLDYTVAGVTEPVVTPPAGYIFDHWETSTGETFTFGVSRGDVTVHPVYRLDYSAPLADLPAELIVTTQAEFEAIINNHASENFDGKTIKLYCDVSTTGSFKGFGNGVQTVRFKGTLDGNGHTIDVSSHDSSFNGLIQDNAGIVKNLVIESSVCIESSSTAGGIAVNNRGTIENCGNKASINAHNAGGIAGQNMGTISGCYNLGTIESPTQSTGTSGFNPNGYCAGGIAGNASSGTITDCYNKGCIGGYMAGGIAGICSSCTIRNGYGGGTFGHTVFQGYIAGALTAGGSACYNAQNLYCTVPTQAAGSSSQASAGTSAYGDPGQFGSGVVRTDIDTFINSANSGAVSPKWERGSDGKPRLTGAPGQ